MSFSGVEMSRADGMPVELFLFRYGTGSTNYYAYTNAEQAITHLGITYVPVPIGRDSLKSSGTLDKAALTVDMAVELELAELFRIYPPSQVVSLIIRQGHANDPAAEFPVAWSGRVLGGSREGSVFSATCEPVATSMRRPGLRRNYQYGCPHVLYGTSCRANKAAATSSATVSSVTSNRVTLTSSWASSGLKPKYAGGIISWTAGGRTEIRTILRVSTDTLTCSGALSGMSAGMTVSVILGCNRTMDDCGTLHSNINNFGGQPWIPTKNPIGLTNNYY